MVGHHHRHLLRIRAASRIDLELYARWPDVHGPFGGTDARRGDEDGDRHDTGRDVAGTAIEGAISCWGVVIEKAQRSCCRVSSSVIEIHVAGMRATTLHDWRAIVLNRADGYELFGETLVGSRRRYQFSIVSHYGVASTILCDLGAVRRRAFRRHARLRSHRAADVDAGAAGRQHGRRARGVGYGFGWFLEKFERGTAKVDHGGSTGTCFDRLPDDGVSTIVPRTNLEQASGSDPCFIARAIAARGSSRRSRLWPFRRRTTPTPHPRLAAGAAPWRPSPRARSIPSALYTLEAFQAIRVGGRSQHETFERLGPIQSFQSVADDTLVSEVLRYRVGYGTRRARCTSGSCWTRRAGLRR